MAFVWLGAVFYICMGAICALVEWINQTSAEVYSSDTAADYAKEGYDPNTARNAGIIAIAIMFLFWWVALPASLMKTGKTIVRSNPTSH